MIALGRGGNGSGDRLTWDINGILNGNMVHRKNVVLRKSIEGNIGNDVLVDIRDSDGNRVSVILNDYDRHIRNGITILGTTLPGTNPC